MRGTDGSGPTMRSSFATIARQPAKTSGGKLLDEIAKEHGAALEVERHHFGRDQVALHHDLIDLLVPSGAWHISEVSIKDYVLPLLPQSWRSVDLGAGISALPFWEK